MNFFKRLPELVSDRQGQLSATNATTMVALLVSSVVVLLCAYQDHAPDLTLGIYLGAWVTHAGVQTYHDRRMDGAGPSAPPQGGQPDGRDAD